MACHRRHLYKDLIVYSVFSPIYLDKSDFSDTGIDPLLATIPLKEGHFKKDSTNKQTSRVIPFLRNVCSTVQSVNIYMF